MRQWSPLGFLDRPLVLDWAGTIDGAKRLSPAAAFMPFSCMRSLALKATRLRSNSAQVNTPHQPFFGQIKLKKSEKYTAALFGKVH
jgi:hypothetical protein